MKAPRPSHSRVQGERMAGVAYLEREFGQADGRAGSIGGSEGESPTSWIQG